MDVRYECFALDLDERRRTARDAAADLRARADRQRCNHRLKTHGDCAGETGNGDRRRRDRTDGPVRLTVFLHGLGRLALTGAELDGSAATRAADLAVREAGCCAEARRHVREKLRVRILRMPGGKTGKRGARVHGVVASGRVGARRDRDLQRARDGADVVRRVDERVCRQRRRPGEIRIACRGAGVGACRADERLPVGCRAGARFDLRGGCRREGPCDRLRALAVAVEPLGYGEPSANERQGADRYQYE